MLGRDYKQKIKNLWDEGSSLEVNIVRIFSTDLDDKPQVNASRFYGTKEKKEQTEYLEAKKIILETLASRKFDPEALYFSLLTVQNKATKPGACVSPQGEIFQKVGFVMEKIAETGIDLSGAIRIAKLFNGSG